MSGFDADAVGREHGEMPPPDALPDGAVVVSLASVEPRAVDWLWPGRIPLGKLTLIVGDPGLGKSFLALDAAARVSKGMAWPDGVHCPSGAVVLLTAEDGLADTVVPRLITMGADRERVHALTAVRKAGRERPFSLAVDLPRLDDVVADVERVGQRVRLVIVDPVSAYLGGDTDSYVDAEVRAVLAPLAQLADRRQIAVVGVLHLNKGTAKAIYRVLGSVGFVAAARSALVVTPDPANAEGPRRLFAPLKMNLAPRPLTLAFAIDGSRIAWEAEPVLGVNVEDALRGPVAEAYAERGAREDAEDFLQAELAEGPRLVRELQAAAREAGISWRTIERAKASLGIAAHREGFGGPWRWELGAIDRQGRQERHGGGDGGLRPDMAVYGEPAGKLVSFPGIPAETDPMVRAAADLGITADEEEERP